MTRRRASVALLLAACFASATLSARPTQPPPQTDQLDIEGYDRLVKAYRAGEVDAATRDRIAFARGEDTARAWFHYGMRTTLEFELKGLERRDIATQLLAGSALEVETGRAQITTGRRQEGFEHLMLAIALVDSPDWTRQSEVVSTRAKEERHAVRRSVYLLTAAILHGEFELVALARHVDRMVNALPDDAAANLAAGSLYETYTLPGVVARLQPPIGVTIDPGLWRRQRVDSGRRDALSRYRRATTLDPTLSEAQLRLGRMLTQRRDWASAETALRAARASAGDSHTRYLSALFLGDLLHERQRTSDAIAVLRSAVEVSPDAQSARLALSAALRAAGDAAGADAATEPLLRRHVSSDMANDPWWLYRYGQRWRIREWIDALRQAVRA